MKISLSTKNIRKKTKCSRKYLAKAALYRRIVTKDNKNPNYAKESDAFSLEKLLELYEFESRGTVNGERGAKLSYLIQDNGYAYGKHLYDISVSQMIQDVKDGLFYKCEFMETDLERLHNKPILDDVFIEPNKIEYPFPTEYVRSAIKLQLENNKLSELSYLKYLLDLVDKLKKATTSKAQTILKECVNKVKHVHSINIESLSILMLFQYQEKMSNWESVKQYIENQIKLKEQDIAVI